MAEYKGVMVYAEVAEGKLTTIATESLGCGRRLADDLGQELSAALAGSDVAGLAQEAIAFGADKVYVVDDLLLKDYQTDSYVLVMEKVVRQVMPRILLMGHTFNGRDLAPRLAFRLGTTATTGCVELAIDPDSKQVLRTKFIYAGNAQAIFSSDFYPQIATIIAKVMSPLQRDASRQGEVITIDAGLAPSAIRTKILEKVKEEVAGIKLEDAKVVISGGRGIGSAEGFKQLEEVAKILSAAVGASRPACDNGWMPSTKQIGLTGKVVAPDLYIAVAISGSSQHMRGCSSSKNILAINRDPEANIFKVARFGVVGDWREVIPAFASKIKELLAE